MIAVGKNIFRIAAIGLSSTAIGTVAMGASPGASPQTTSMMVTATVVSSCSVSAGTMAFPNYTGSLVTQNTTITANCSTITTPTITLDGGISGSTTNTRYMTNGATPPSQLNYTLWQNASGTSNPWIGTASQSMGQTNTSGVATITVYGVIPANQIVPPGGYSDTVNVTMTF